MTDLNYTILEDRGLLSISGEDSITFLQGLVSNDVRKVTHEHTAYGALLTPQGKFLYDFFMGRQGETILIDSEGERLGSLIQKLTMYKLRSKVELNNVTEKFSIVALYGANTLSKIGLSSVSGSSRKLNNGVLFVDPRTSEMGARIILPKDQAKSISEKLGFSEKTIDYYNAIRIPLGLPDGSRDMIVEKAILLENGFDELNGVDWNKGCFIGQELTARTKYRGLIKKRLVPVTFAAAPPPVGTLVMVGDKEVGEVRSASGKQGLALMRLEFLKNLNAEFLANGIKLTPQKPFWAKF